MVWVLMVFLVLIRAKGFNSIRQVINSLSSTHNIYKIETVSYTFIHLTQTVRLINLHKFTVENTAKSSTSSNEKSMHTHNKSSYTILCTKVAAAAAAQLL